MSSALIWQGSFFFLELTIHLKYTTWIWQTLRKEEYWNFYSIWFASYKRNKLSILLKNFYSVSEHVTSIIASLLRNSHGTQRQRLLSKFTENDHEKVERLMELHFKYLDKVRQCDDSIEKEKVVSIPCFWNFFGKAQQKQV